MPGSSPTHVWAIYFNKIAKKISGEKTFFSINDVGIAEHPKAREKEQWV